MDVDREAVGGVYHVPGVNEPGHLFGPLLRKLIFEDWVAFSLSSHSGECSCDHKQKMPGSDNKWYAIT